MTTQDFRIMTQKVAFGAIHIDYLLVLHDIDQRECDLVTDLIYVYLETAPSVVEEIINASVNFDFESMLNAVTKLEFGSDRIGARRLGALCRQANLQAMMNRPNEMDQWLEQVQEEFFQVERELCLVRELLRSAGL